MLAQSSSGTLKDTISSFLFVMADMENILPFNTILSRRGCALTVYRPSFIRTGAESLLY